MKAAASALFIAITAPASGAQDINIPAQSDDNTAFFHAVIPKNVPATLTCHQVGAEIVSLAQIARFLPSLMGDFLTCSRITSDGCKHLIYLGANTTCRLTVTPP